MNYFNGTISYGTTGVQAPITVGFQPSMVRVTMGQKYGTTQTVAHLSVGSGTPSFQHVNSFYQDTTGGKSLSEDAKVVDLWDRVSGTLTQMVDISIYAFGTDSITLSIAKANVNYQLYIEVFG